jgi:hypothetical protein
MNFNTSRFFVLVLLALASLFFAGCQNPTGPSKLTDTHEHIVRPMVHVPQHHNIVATFADHPEGPMIYLCATLPRPTSDGYAEDHYLQYDPCPIVSIP